MELQHTSQQWILGGTRINWGAVFAGLVVGIAIQIMLTLLGLSIGAWTIDLREPEAGQGIPIGSAIWTAVSLLISAFSGGYVTARMSGAYLRRDGLFHGAVVWGFNWVVFAWLMTTAMSALIGGLFSTFGAGLQTFGQGVIALAAQTGGKPNSNISMEALQREIDSVLQATGKPALQPSEIKQNVESRSLKSADEAVAELRQKLVALDREAAVNIMVNKLGMSKSQAQEVVQSTTGMVQNVKAQTIDFGNAAISQVGATAGWIFILTLLSLGMSLAGGAFGISDSAVVEKGR